MENTKPIQQQAAHTINLNFLAIQQEEENKTKQNKLSLNYLQKLCWYRGLSREKKKIAFFWTFHVFGSIS